MSWIVTCQHCGERFARPSMNGPAPRYCSNAHRQQAFQRRRKAELQRLRELEQEVTRGRQ